MKAVSFDFGQTLAELDYEFLARRVRERGTEFDPVEARAGSAAAWAIYGAKKDRGHAEAWRAMMEEQLRAGGVTGATASELGEWLWQEQPRRNLWRLPIPGMIELVRSLRGVGVPVGIISNSEGHLAELVAELGWSRDFDIIVDSGKVGLDKPDPRIFHHTCAGLGIPSTELLHVGDSWEADVKGALAASAQAVWFDAEHRTRALPAGVHGASTAQELREVLARLSFAAMT